jgi:hypothetical protein
MLPQLTEKHIFNVFDKMAKMRTKQASMDRAVATGKHSALGTVDILTATVGGDFSTITAYLLLPAGFLMFGDLYDAVVVSPEEVAAIILHEMGHLFTSFEYLNRVTATNQVLATLSDAQANQPETYEILVTRTASEREYNAEVTQALKKAKNPEEVAIVLFGGEIERCITQIGGSVFEASSCEQLADQFAVRMGAGMYLATSLAKLEDLRGSGHLLPLAGNILIGMGYIATIGFSAAVLAGIYVTLALIIVSVSIISMDRLDLYGDFQSRLSRLRADMVEQIKRVKFTGEQRELILEQIAKVDEILKGQKSNLSIMETIAYYLRPGYRSNYKYEMLQRQIEALAANGLFVKAERFKVLADKTKP